jgi:hypothetical protein
MGGHQEALNLLDGEKYREGWVMLTRNPEVYAAIGGYLDRVGSLRPAFVQFHMFTASPVFRRSRTIAR